MRDLDVLTQSSQNTIKGKKLQQDELVNVTKAKDKSEYKSLQMHWEFSQRALEMNFEFLQDADGSMMCETYTLEKVGTVTARGHRVSKREHEKQQVRNSHWTINNNEHKVDIILQHATYRVSNTHWSEILVSPPHQK